MLAGAFSAGKGLKLTKEEKREEAELRELRRLADAPPWCTPHLLSELRERACKEELPSTSLAGAPVAVQDAVLRGRAVGMLDGAAATAEDPQRFALPSLARGRVLLAPRRRGRGRGRGRRGQLSCGRTESLAPWGGLWSHLP